MTTTIRHRVTNVNGATLHLAEAGEPGAPLILLSHGFPECAYSWRHQMEPLATAGYHVIAPDQRGYGHSSAPHDVTFYGINNLAGDLCALIDEQGHEQAIFVGHDWGAIIVWETARLFPERVKAVVGVSVGFTQWPMRPTELFKAAFGDRFFYMSYFQNIGPPEQELDANPRDSMSKVLWGASKMASLVFLTNFHQWRAPDFFRVQTHLHRFRGAGSLLPILITTQRNTHNQVSLDPLVTTATLMPTTRSQKISRLIASQCHHFLSQAPTM